MSIIHLGIGLGLIGLGTWFFLKQIQNIHEEERTRSRSPFKEKRLRVPGEGLISCIEHTRDDLLERFLILTVAVVAPGAVFIGCSLTKSSSSIVTTGFILLGAISMWAYHWPRVRKLRERLRNLRLGLDGERYVAEKLVTLSERGYRAFHDFPFRMKAGGSATDFNIDHIVVGPAGVFVIETKTLRQPLGDLEGDQKSHQVRLVGEELIFPKGYRTCRPVRQAKRAAEDLSQWLTGSSPKQVTIVPVVAMPGWFVEDDRTGEVRVVNAKALPMRLPYLGKGGSLNEEEIRRLSDRIEAHCRDVDGSA